MLRGCIAPALLCAECGLSKRPRPRWRGQILAASSIASLSPGSTSPRTKRLASTVAEAKPYYVTTPIFYVNAKPHIGHLHSCVVADVLARWSSWRGAVSGQSLETVLSTGTDEHGLKIQTQAQLEADKRGGDALPDPQGLCDRISQNFKHLADVADIQYTRFIRTTDEDHKEAVRHFWRQLQERGHIYKGSHEGWYAISDEAFYTENAVKDVVDEHSGERYKVSIETGSRVEWSKEENYKFRMSAFRDRLIRWLEDQPTAIQPSRFYNEVLEELRSQELQDLSISRPSSRLQWGIAVPDDPAHTMYVWIDALINYATVTGYPWGGERLAGSAWPPNVQVVGKDILRFHAVYWPSMLLALDLPLPRTILTHSHWKMGQGKMSKSRGNVVDPIQVIDEYGSDALRWFLMRIGGNFAEDAVYAPSKLAEYYKKSLAGQLGNLVMRIAAVKLEQRLVSSLGDTLIDAGDCWEIPNPIFEPSDEPYIREVDGLAGIVEGHMSRFEMAPALERIGNVLEACNTLVSHLQPWKPEEPLANPSKSMQRHRAMFLARETLRIVGALYRPFMPRTMKQMLEDLRITEAETSWERLRIGGGPVKVEKARESGGGKVLQALFPSVL